MNIRFYHALLLTMEENRAIFEGELWIKDERIVYAGDGGDKDTAEAIALFGRSQKRDILWDEEIDCQGNLLMPGFKNAHTHSGMTLLRSYADDLPLQAWLNEQVFPIEAKLSEEDIYYLTKLAVLEYLTSGITSIFDMYLTPESIARACADMGMRCVQTGGVNNFSQSVELLEKWYEELNGKHPLLSFLPGFHAEYTCSKELMEEIAGFAARKKAPIYVHLSETEAEVAGCRERYGMSPGIFLDSLGMFDYGGGVYHGVWLTKEEMKLFKEKGVSVITNPGSNTKLASGIAPVSSFLEEGLNVAIGTDGPASNNCLDMFREMFLVAGLSRVREGDASSPDAMRVLRMATVQGARAMRLSKADVLAKGKYADIIMIDLHQPNMQPIHNIPKNLVYSGSKSNVCMTMINGKILYYNREFNVGDSVENIYAKCDEIVRRLVNA